WLRRYGSSRQGQSEAVAVKWYLGLALQTQGDRLVPPPPKVPPGTTPPPQTVPATARQYYAAAERLYRAISQTDNEYSDRATKQRFIVVRRLLGEADRPPAEYTTFEESQMASLIQISKLIEEEKAAGPDEAAQKALDARRTAIVALLE